MYLFPVMLRSHDDKMPPMLQQRQRAMCLSHASSLHSPPYISAKKTQQQQSNVYIPNASPSFTVVVILPNTGCYFMCIRYRLKEPGISRVLLSLKLLVKHDREMLDGWRWLMARLGRKEDVRARVCVCVWCVYTASCCCSCSWSIYFIHFRFKQSAALKAFFSCLSKNSKADRHRILKSLLCR